MENKAIKFKPEGEKYTVVRIISKGSGINRSQLQFIEYHETKLNESLSTMIKRNKIDNIAMIFKGFIEEAENW
jgi:hypothetical protein